MDLPALQLESLSDVFTTKLIPLTDGQRVRLGRAMDCRADRWATKQSGYFPSKVLSRQHAEVWEENGKVCDHIMTGALQARLRHHLIVAPFSVSIRKLTFPRVDLP